MIDVVWTWITDNKQWLFSGLGIVILGLILRFGKSALAFGGGLLKTPPTPIPPTPTQAPDSDSKRASLQEAMQETQILFIDDDVKFKVISILQTAGWQHTRIVKDIASLDDEVVNRAHILFVDINGVGKKLGFKDEGLGLALALKTRYPSKRVIIYSADTKAERFHDAWKKADEYLAKNADPYEFQQLVEDYAMNRGSS